ncbi:MAG: Glutamine-dependent NAD(+) synthetase [Chlamydiae bacterium]|nr:Glutamine-dependent NAD(+) synthetase [Chlamydiota bacterium]
MRVALGQINPIVGGIEYNKEKILKFLGVAKEKGAELVVFPEMALCGYPPEDLLLLPRFVDALNEALDEIRKQTKGIAVVIGTVRENLHGGEKGLYNTAAILQEGELVGFQDKTLLPDYDVFSERRYFEPATRIDVWSLLGKRVAVTICEDIWQHAGVVEYATYPRDPVTDIEPQAPDLLLNLSASPFHMQRQDTRLLVLEKCAQTLKCPIAFCNQVGGNDSLIFDGSSCVVNGKSSLFGKSFQEDMLFFDLESLPATVKRERDPISDLYHALCLGVRDYFHKQGFQKACFGLSGGIDSAVVACIAARALGKENLLTFALPSRYSSKESVVDAKRLARRLEISLEEISIEGPFQAFLDLLEPHFEQMPAGVTEENLQARIRAVILMAFSNKFGHLLLGTGNKSEMAVGYSTLYGDMCGGLGVLSDVTKGQVYALARFINRSEEIIPKEILEKAPSAELRPNQKDSDALPPYEVLDIVLQEYVEEHLSPEKVASKHGLDLLLVKELVHKIHENEYKRQQAPPGLRVTKKAFTVGRRFPIVQDWNRITR